MQYSLLGRFRGGLLGSLLGEILASSTENSGVFGNGLDLKNINILYDRNQENSSNISQETIANWSQIANSSIESLIRCGTLDVEDWLEEAGKVNPSLLYLKGKANSHEAALATLPIALFFHDNPVGLQQKLKESAEIWLSDKEDVAGVYAVGFAIALALTENININTLIPQILSQLKSSQTPLAQQLEEVQTLLEQRADLETTLFQLRRLQSNQNKQKNCPNTSIALAFYCFLNNPEDFRISVTRAIRSGYQPKMTAAIAGILSGVYNSMVGIPVGWRVAAQRNKIWQKRQQLASRLLAVWSGVWDIGDIELSNLVAVAGAGVIQSRSGRSRASLSS